MDQLAWWVRFRIQYFAVFGGVVAAVLFLDGRLTLLTFAAVLGLIPAYIATRKGESFGYWWLFGLGLWIVALPVALVLRPDQAALDRREGTRACPWCAERIKDGARVCRFCQREVEPVDG